MKKEKILKFLKLLLRVNLTLAIAYLIGAFVHNSFDHSTWTHHFKLWGSLLTIYIIFIEVLTSK